MYLFNLYSSEYPYAYERYSRNNVFLPLADTGTNVTGNYVSTNPENGSDLYDIWTINSVLYGPTFNSKYGHNFINNTLGVLRPDQDPLSALPLPFNFQQKNNIFGNNVKNNIFGIGTTDNFIYGEFYNNTIYYVEIPFIRTDFFAHNNIYCKVSNTDFSNSTLIYKRGDDTFLTEIIGNQNQLPKLRYIDEFGATIINNITD
jgi:hypothetical protein